MKIRARRKLNVHTEKNMGLKAVEYYHAENVPRSNRKRARYGHKNYSFSLIKKAKGVNEKNINRKCEHYFNGTVSDYFKEGAEGVIRIVLTWGEDSFSEKAAYIKVVKRRDNKQRPENGAKKRAGYYYVRFF